jgi:hypothetical protein
MSEEKYYSERYRELNRQLAKRERSQKRQSRESLAARGALHSGMTGATEREIEGGIGEEFTRGARDIEDRRWRSSQDEIAHQRQLEMQKRGFGEAERQRTWGTGERTGSEQWKSGESEAERNVRMKLQQMSDAERFRLQELVNSGAMDLQEAENKWTSYENDLNRQLEEWQSSGQWGHEAGMQAETIAQEQWSAMFGADAAMALQDDTQTFEEFMANLGRKWELSDRPWIEMMHLMDSQLQMLAAGYDWLDDNYSQTGYPAWMVGREGGTQYTDTSMYAGGGGGDLGGSGGYVSGGGGLTYDQQQVYNSFPPELQAQWDSLSSEQQQHYLDLYANLNPGGW